MKRVTASVSPVFALFRAGPMVGEGVTELGLLIATEIPDRSLPPGFYRMLRYTCLFPQAY